MMKENYVLTNVLVKLLLISIFIAERYVVISQLSYGDLVTLKVVDEAGRVLQSGENVQPQTRVSLQCNYLHNNNNTVETIVLSDTPAGEVDNWNYRNLVICRNGPPTQPHSLSFQRLDLVESPACAPGLLTAMVSVLNRSAFRYRCQFFSQSISDKSIVALRTNVRNVLTLYAVDHRGDHIYSGEPDVQAKTFLEIRCVYDARRFSPVDIKLVGTSLKNVGSNSNLLITCQANNNTPVLTDNAKNFVDTQCTPGYIKGKMRVPNIAPLHYSCRMQLSNGTSAVERMSFSPRVVDRQRMDCFATKSNGQEIQTGTYVKPGTPINIRCLYIPGRKPISRLNSNISGQNLSYLLGCSHHSGQEKATIIHEEKLNLIICVLGTIGGTMPMPDIRNFTIKASATSLTQAEEQKGELFFFGEETSKAILQSDHSENELVKAGSSLKFNCSYTPPSSKTGVLAFLYSQVHSNLLSAYRHLITCQITQNARAQVKDVNNRDILPAYKCSDDTLSVTVVAPTSANVSFLCTFNGSHSFRFFNTYESPTNPVIRQIAPMGKILEGENFRFQCISTGRPPPNLQFTYNLPGSLITRQQPYKIRPNSSRATTKLFWSGIATKSMNGRKLVCQVVVEDPAKFNASVSLTTTVYYGPNPGEDKSVFWNLNKKENLNLPCNMDAYGLIRYEWYREFNKNEILARTKHVELSAKAYKNVGSELLANLGCKAVNQLNKNKTARMKFIIYRQDFTQPLLTPVTGAIVGVVSVSIMCVASLILVWALRNQQKATRRRVRKKKRKTIN